jgi:phytoene desaturase
VPGSVIVIGSGFAGLSAASFMAKAGWEVTVIEKHPTPGGRARQWKENGFTFDMGPSWYWMPDVFERYFSRFNKKVSDYYSLTRLDPSYRVYTVNGNHDIPAGMEALEIFFEKIEPSSGAQLHKYLQQAESKYTLGIKNLVYKPGISVTEFFDWEMIKGFMRMDVFVSMKKHIARFFKNPFLQQLMEFPILFLGALPENTPALYSLMNYADMVGGTWYPEKGMYSIVDGMYRLCLELGVKFNFNEEVTKLVVESKRITGIQTKAGDHYADVVISAADYHFTETKLLPQQSRSYSDEYWEKRVMAPSCLIFYIGLNRRINNLRHHSLFFDAPFDKHAAALYANPQWPEDPLFYMSATSVTDASVAPPGCENLFCLIPVASGLTKDSQELRDKYFDVIMQRLEKNTGENIRDAVVYLKTFSVSDFVNDYHAFRGNAYGLANSLRQTAVLKPGCRSKKIKNLFYTGQMTVPGPGVPPSLIGGEVVANEVVKNFR